MPHPFPRFESSPPRDGAGRSNVCRKKHVEPPCSPPRASYKKRAGSPNCDPPLMQTNLVLSDDPRLGRTEHERPQHFRVGTQHVLGSEATDVYNKNHFLHSRLGTSNLIPIAGAPGVADEDAYFFNNKHHNDRMNMNNRRAVDVVNGANNNGGRSMNKNVRDEIAKYTVVEHDTLQKVPKQEVVFLGGRDPNRDDQKQLVTTLWTFEQLEPLSSSTLYTRAISLASAARDGGFRFEDDESITQPISRQVDELIRWILALQAQLCCVLMGEQDQLHNRNNNIDKERGRSTTSSLYNDYGNDDPAFRTKLFNVLQKGTEAAADKLLVEGGGSVCPGGSAPYWKQILLEMRRLGAPNRVLAVELQRPMAKLIRNKEAVPTTTNSKLSQPALGDHLKHSETLRRDQERRHREKDGYAADKYSGGGSPDEAPHAGFSPREYNKDEVFERHHRKPSPLSRKTHFAGSNVKELVEGQHRSLRRLSPHRPDHDVLAPDMSEDPPMRHVEATWTGSGYTTEGRRHIPGKVHYNLAEVGEFMPGSSAKNDKVVGMGHGRKYIDQTMGVPLSRDGGRVQVSGSQRYR